MAAAVGGRLAGGKAIEIASFPHKISDLLRWNPALLRSTSAGNDAARRIARAQRIWNAAQDARGSPVAHYLADRGISPSLCRLRCATRPRCGARTALCGPAMVARIDGPDGALIGVAAHLDRARCSRSMAAPRSRDARPGRRWRGAARTRSRDADGRRGRRDLLAAMPATGLPGWAALSTSGLVALTLPPIVRTVIILADHDRSGAGERAAYAPRRDCSPKVGACRIALTPKPGTDFADVLANGANTPSAEVRLVIRREGPGAAWHHRDSPRSDRARHLARAGHAAG